MSLTANIAACFFDLDGDCGEFRLAPAEIERAASISNPLMRKRYQATRSRVRQVLAARLGIAPEDVAIEVAPGGKPQLTPSHDLHFSISHSQNLLVIALCNAPVGVDIEIPRARDNALALAERFFSAPDFQALAQMPPAARDAAFLQQWVAKEAALKAAGFGLADLLREAHCQFFEGRVQSVSWPGHCALVAPFGLPSGAIGAFAWFGDPGAAIRWHDAGEFAS